MSGVEYGVRYVSAIDEFIAPGYNESGARSMVEHLGDAKKNSPHAAAVMFREVGEWQELDDSSGAVS